MGLIVDAVQTTNALFLRLILDELKTSAVRLQRDSTHPIHSSIPALAIPNKSTFLLTNPPPPFLIWQVHETVTELTKKCLKAKDTQQLCEM